jgi:hypothetical protein
VGLKEMMVEMVFPQNLLLLQDLVGVVDTLLQEVMHLMQELVELVEQELVFLLLIQEHP